MENVPFWFSNKSLIHRFISDNNLPMTFVDCMNFEYQLDLYEEKFKTRTKWNALWDEIRTKFDRNPEKFLQYYAEVRDNMIKSIESNPVYKDEFLTFDMNKFAVPSLVGDVNIYNRGNIGKYFMSIDLRKANFQAIKKFNPSLVKDSESYEDFVRKFTDSEYIINSKYTRQVVFGKVNPKRQVTIEKYITYQVYKFFTEYYNYKLVSFKYDELVFEIDEDEFKAHDTYTEFIKYNTGVDVRVEKFKLSAYHLVKESNDHPRDDFFVKEFYEDNKFDELMCVPRQYHMIVYQLYWNGEAYDEDYKFEYEGIPCRFMEKFYLEDVNS